METIFFTIKGMRQKNLAEWPKTPGPTSPIYTERPSTSMSLIAQSPPPIPKRLVKTALHQAVLDGRLHQVRLLVSKHGSNIDCKDIYGRTPLMLTSMIDEEAGSKMARILINEDAAMSLRDNMGRTALGYACMNGRELIVNEILREDVLNINEPDNDGSTPLHHAAISGNPNIVHLLVELFVKFGLDIDTRNKLGYTALLLACRHGHFVSAHKLLHIGGASPTLRDGETFLNASEWMQKIARYNHFPIRRLIVPPSAPAFCRENTMYQKRLTPECKHGGTKSAVLSWARGENPAAMSRSETFIEGKDAREIVLNEINHVEAQNRSQSIKSAAVVKKRTHPPTAKLMAMSRRNRSAVTPDMAAIFKIYSDQYQPDWRREKTIALHTSTNDKIPSITRTVAQNPPKHSIEVTG